MTDNNSRRLLLVLAAAWAIPAAAQNVYRCGDSYSQQPCPGGKQVPTDDARSAAQRAQTTEAARRDAKAADEMEKARLKDEAKAGSAVIPAAKLEAATDPADRTESSAKAKKPAYFTAVSPKKAGEAKAVKKKKKAKKKTPA